MPKKTKRTLSYHLVVTYDGYDHEYDHRIEAAFNIKGVESTGTGYGFMTGGRDVFFDVYSTVNMKDIKAAIKRVNRWVKYKTHVELCEV
jgi:hypothetical protein